jgi:hypothetical protein
MGAANPLRAMGVRRWIIVLPRPGEGGYLIINPDPSELAGFTTTHMLPRQLDSGAGMAGLSRLWSYSVLYDAGRGTMSIRPRQ